MWTGQLFPGRNGSVAWGGIMAPGLLLNKQVVAVAQRAFHQPALASQWQACLGRKDLATMAHALDAPGLDYCNALICRAALEMCWGISVGAEHGSQDVGWRDCVIPVLESVPGHHLRCWS